MAGESCTKWKTKRRQRDSAARMREIKRAKLEIAESVTASDHGPSSATSTPSQQPVAASILVVQTLHSPSSQQQPLLMVQTRRTVLEVRMRGLKVVMTLLQTVIVSLTLRLYLLTG